FTSIPSKCWWSGGKGRDALRKDRKSCCARCGTVGRLQRRHDHSERARGECEERTGSRLNARGDLASRQNQNKSRQNDGWKEAGCRKLRHERGERRQNRQ